MALISAGSKQRMGTWTYPAPHDPIYGNVILLYHCEDNAASTTVTDSSGNAYNGTASANTSTIYNATGKFNGGFYLNDSAYLTNNTAAMLTAAGNACRAGITVEFWAKNDSTDWSAQGDQTMLILYKDGNNFINFEYSSGANTFYAQCNFNGTNKQVTFAGTSPIDTDTWHHYAIVSTGNAGTMKLYIDGAQVGSTQTACGNFNGDPANLYVGCTNTTAKTWDGMIDEVTISNVVRY